MTREECIKWLKSLKTEIGKSEHGALWHYAESIDTVIEELTDRPTGHIVTNCSGKFNPTVWAECSECGTPIDVCDKFCRHCGAKMQKQAR